MLARKFSGIISQKRVSPCVKNWQRLSVRAELAPKDAYALGRLGTYLFFLVFYIDFFNTFVAMRHLYLRARLSREIFYVLSY